MRDNPIRVSLTPDSRVPVPFNRAIRTEDKPGRFIPAHPVSPLPVLRASLIPERPIRDNPVNRVGKERRGNPMRGSPDSPFTRAIRTGDKPDRSIPARPVSPIPGLSAPIRDSPMRANPVNRARSKDHRASPMRGNRDSPTPAKRDNPTRDRRLPALPRSLSPVRPGKWRPAGRIRPGLPPAGTRTLPAGRKRTDPGPQTADLSGRRFPEKPRKSRGKRIFFRGQKGLTNPVEMNIIDVRKKPFEEDFSADLLRTRARAGAGVKFPCGGA